MGEAIRVRLEGWMRTKINKHAADLTKAVGHRVSVGGAIRDLASRALRGTTTESGYVSGYTQGFLAGYSDGKQAGIARTQRGQDDSASTGPIRPHPTNDNGDYRDREESE
jgi:hypothetical protein